MKELKETEYQDIEIGKWYYLDTYGSDCFIRAKIIAKFDGDIYAKFYWGAPYRTTQKLGYTKVLNETTKPLLPFSNGRM